MSDITFLTQSRGGAIHIVRFERQDSFVTFVQKHVLRTKTGPIERLELAHLNHGDGHEEVLLVPGERPELHIHGGEANERALLNLIDQCALRENTNEEIRIQQYHEQRWHRAFQCCRGERAQSYLLSLLEKGFGVVPMDPDIEIEGYDYLKPFRVVFVGPPNTGKSTLFNALLGENKALVSNLSGTTRDLLKANIILDGWEIELVDTAGLHPEALSHQYISKDHIQGESEIIAIEAVRTADLVFAFRCQLPEGFVPAEKVVEIHSMCEDGRGLDHQIQVSVHQKKGLDALTQVMIERVTKQKSGIVSSRFFQE